MSSKVSVSREYLVKAANLVRPAVSNQSYIPALTHINFEQGWATAFNDVSAIAVKSPLPDLNCCLPGELLIKALGSFNAAEVMIQENFKAASVVVSSGRSRLTLPTLSNEDFPFEWPSGNATRIQITDAILLGIQRCLISVGSDPTHPAQMGVTIESDDSGQAVLYSTDNFTISRYGAATKDGKIKLPADSPVILPTFFCEQLVALAKVFADAPVTLCLLPGGLLATFGDEAQLFTKAVMDTEPMDFAKMVNRYFKVGEVRRQHQELPEGFEASLGRALLVLSGTADKTTMFTIEGSSITLQSTSDLGDSNDTLNFKDGDHCPEKPFLVDPSLVLRATKVCSKMTCLPKVLLMSNEDASFIHMISHCGS